MTKRILPRSLWTLLLTLALVPAAHANETGHDMRAAMTQAVEHYTAIAQALASDSTEGVARRASALQESMPMMGDGEGHAMHEGDNGHAMHSMHGKKGEHAAMGHASMTAALKTLADENTSLDAAREAFVALSSAFVPMAQAHFATAGADDAYQVVHCAMAPGDGDWIQAKGENENPFFGSKMLRCGNPLGALGAEATAKKMHELHGDEGESGDAGMGHHMEHGGTNGQ